MLIWDRRSIRFSPAKLEKGVNNLKKRKRIGSITVCLAMYMLTAVFFSIAEASGNSDEPICGGKVTRTDYNAPKVILSDSITAFYCDFFRYGDYGSEGDAFYRFKATKTEDDNVAISEQGLGITCTTDLSLMHALQDVIERYGLVAFNGIDEYTSGLPWEYAPYCFSTVYESGETLYFCENNDPWSEWTGEILRIMREAFHQCGIDDLMPPAETTQITRFSLSFTDENIQYRYGELLVPIKETGRTLEDIVTNGINKNDYVTRIEYEYWDRGMNTGYALYLGDPDEDYYTGLQKLVTDTCLAAFANNETCPFTFDYDNTPCYYEFYIEYAYGNTLYGFSDDPEVNAAFLSVAHAFSDFIQQHIVFSPEYLI